MRPWYITVILVFLAACSAGPEPQGPAATPPALKESKSQRLRRLSSAWLPPGLEFYEEVPVKGGYLLLIGVLSFKKGITTDWSGSLVVTSVTWDSNAFRCNNTGDRDLFVPAGLLLRHDAEVFMTRSAVQVPPRESREIPCLSVTPGWEHDLGSDRAVFADWRLRAECFHQGGQRVPDTLQRLSSGDQASPRMVMLAESVGTASQHHHANAVGVALAVGDKLVAMDYFERIEVSQEAFEGLLAGYLAGVALGDIDDPVSVRTGFVAGRHESSLLVVEETPLAEVIRGLPRRYHTYLHPDIDGDATVSGEIGSTTKSVAAFLGGLAEEGSRTWVCWHGALRLVPLSKADEKHQSPIWQNAWLLDVAGRNDPSTRKNASLVKERAQSMTEAQRRALAEHYADEMAKLLEPRMKVADTTSAWLATGDLAETLETMRVCAEAGIWTRRCEEICLWAQLLSFEAREVLGEEPVGPSGATFVHRTRMFSRRINVTWNSVKRPGGDSPAQVFAFD